MVLLVVLAALALLVPSHTASAHAQAMHEHPAAAATPLGEHAPITGVDHAGTAHGEGASDHAAPNSGLAGSAGVHYDETSSSRSAPCGPGPEVAAIVSASEAIAIGQATPSAAVQGACAPAIVGPVSALTREPRAGSGADRLLRDCTCRR